MIAKPCPPRGMPAVLILLGTLASGLPAFGSHNLLPNGDFDAAIVSWTLYSASGSVSWDPLEGASGAGALRLQSGAGFTEAASGCFEAPEGAIFMVRARVLNAAPPDRARPG